MKNKYSNLAMIVGLTLVFAPIYLVDEYNYFWYFIAVIGLILSGISGYGAQMEMMGKGDTGDELLREIWQFLMNKLKKKNK